MFFPHLKQNLSPLEKKKIKIKIKLTLLKKASKIVHSKRFLNAACTVILSSNEKIIMPF